ncbi:MAG: response regulator transcription factor [Cyclobacteriaceae bacterium]|nr:response regulator transcription factor [Cyclobacteriaceae bacterium]
MKKKSIMIVEDDREISDLLKLHLKDHGYSVTKIFNGRKAMQLAQNQQHDMILLDIMLPDLNGLEICKELRRQRINTLILMLTSKSDEIDKVLGLEVGADDYITKPFSIRELISRIKALFRRMDAYNHPVGASERLDFGALKIDGMNHKVLLNGKRVELTPKEFSLLILLAKHPGRTYSRGNLLELVWGYQFSGYEHTVNSHINRLRNKIERDISNPEYIITTWGLGYRFNDQIDKETINDRIF